jgi:rSAM/selenodomain-associated transferase 1
MSTAISIMAKAPEPGRVKTRLCPPLALEQAAELSAALLLDTWRATEELTGPRQPDDQHNGQHNAQPDDQHGGEHDIVEVLLVYAGDRTRFPEPVRGLPSFVQRGADLGARMEHAARLGLARAERVIIIGSDLPGLPAARLIEARAALATHDAVLGPSSDGGFYLIGLRACPPGLLSGLAWSVPETHAACAARLVQRRMRLAHIAVFDDVDDIADLRRVARQIRAGQLMAPATARILERLGCV